MKMINNIKQYREWYKNSKHTRQGNNFYEIDFIGVKYGEKQQEKYGFFEMFHGEKDIRGFLRKDVNMAEDGQAIFELIQNAADKDNPGVFYLFYNKKELLAINNGKKFNKESITSLLNVGYSYDKDDADKIGKFGVGFKLVHKLVGKQDGLDELLNEYKGPIVFSWDKIEQLRDFVDISCKLELNEPYQRDNELNEEDAWLFKILMTNFPCYTDEVLKDKDYKLCQFEENIEKKKINDFLFSSNELSDFREFVSKNIPKDNFWNDMSMGSMFYLKLGDGKYENVLKKEYEDLINGVEISLNFIKNLNKVIFKPHKTDLKKIEKTTDLILEKPFIIESTEEDFQLIPLQEEKDKKFPLFFQFGYYSYTSEKQLIGKPNFYKYFPIGDETNTLNFVFHCNVFDLKTDRRRLPKTPINEKLLKLFTDRIKKLIDFYIEKNKHQEYKNIFANLLLSNPPIGDNENNIKGNNEWIYVHENLYKPLMQYIIERVPTTINKSLPIERVRLKKTLLNINPTNFGIVDKDTNQTIEWFDFIEKNDADEKIIKQVEKTKKIKLTRWDIKNLLREGKKIEIEKTIQKLCNEEYQLFFRELSDRKITSAWNFYPGLYDNFIKFEIFRCENGKKAFYSIEQLQDENSILLTNDTFKIKEELKAVGFIVSELNLEELDFHKELKQSNIKYLEQKEELFNHIKNKINITLIDNNPDLVNIKQTIFNTIKDLVNNDVYKLRALKLFKTRGNSIQPLYKILSDKNKTVWLNSYKIEEGFSLDDNLYIKEEDVYSKIILEYFNKIVTQSQVKENPNEFHKELIDKYFKIEGNKDKSPLTNKNYIFINKELGFVNPNDDEHPIYYHEKLREIPTNEKYKLLVDCIFRLTGSNLPDKDILEFLNEPPFNTENSDFAEIEINENIELEKESRELFIKYLIEIGDYKTLKKVKLYKFGENLFSLNEIQKDTFKLLLHDKINNITTELSNLGFITSDIDVSDYKEDLSIGYLSEVEDLFILINKQLLEKKLTNSQRLNIFKEMISWKIDIEDLRDLELFENTNEIVSLRKLINIENCPKFLQPYLIKNDENIDLSILNGYFAQPNEIYQNIINENWVEISENIDESNIKELYETTQVYFDNEEYKNKSPLSVTNYNYVFLHQIQPIISNGISVRFGKPINKIYYNNDLNNYKGDYSELIQALSILLPDHIFPNKEILSFLDKEPFLVSETKIDKNFSISESVSFQNIKTLKTLIDYVEYFFNYFTIIKSDESFKVINESKQCFAEKDSHLFTFIQGNEKLKAEFVLLTEDFYEYVDKVTREVDLEKKVGS